jgi:Pyridine nucleotide-disulphide oxidoreductase, dimerisation domain
VPPCNIQSSRTDAVQNGRRRLFVNRLNRQRDFKAHGLRQLADLKTLPAYTGDFKAIGKVLLREKLVIRNALFFGRDRMSALTVQCCTYTDPEVGYVGLYERDARERGIAVTTFVQELRDVDRAVVDGEVSGFVKVHVREGGNQIVGATIVARHAGEMLSELTLVIARGIGLGAIATVIHPYPTQAEAIKKVADAFNRTRLTPRVRRLFSTWFSLTVTRIAIRLSFAYCKREVSARRRSRWSL